MHLIFLEGFYFSGGGDGLIGGFNYRDVAGGKVWS